MKLITCEPNIWHLDGFKPHLKNDSMARDSTIVASLLEQNDRDWDEEDKLDSLFDDETKEIITVAREFDHVCSKQNCFTQVVWNKSNAIWSSILFFTTFVYYLLGNKLGSIQCHFHNKIVSLYHMHWQRKWQKGLHLGNFFNKLKKERERDS